MVGNMLEENISNNPAMDVKIPVVQYKYEDSEFVKLVREAFNSYLVEDDNTFFTVVARDKTVQVPRSGLMLFSALLRNAVMSTSKYGSEDAVVFMPDVTAQSLIYLATMFIEGDIDKEEEDINTGELMGAAHTLGIDITNFQYVKREVGDKVKSKAKVLNKSSDNKINNSAKPDDNKINKSAKPEENEDTDANSELDDFDDYDMSDDEETLNKLLDGNSKPSGVKARENIENFPSLEEHTLSSSNLSAQKKVDNEHKSKLIPPGPANSQNNQFSWIKSQGNQNIRGTDKLAELVNKYVGNKNQTPMQGIPPQRPNASLQQPFPTTSQLPPKIPMQGMPPQRQNAYGQQPFPTKPHMQPQNHMQGITPQRPNTTIQNPFPTNPYIQPQSQRPFPTNPQLQQQNQQPLPTKIHMQPQNHMQGISPRRTETYLQQPFPINSHLQPQNPLQGISPQSQNTSIHQPFPRELERRQIPQQQINSEPSSPALTCQLCPKDCPRIGMLWQHYATKHFLNELRESHTNSADVANKFCSSCNTPFKSVTSLLIHVGTVHAKVADILVSKGLQPLRVPQKRGTV